jgi:hypothetical protein
VKSNVAATAVAGVVFFAVAAAPLLSSISNKEEGSYHE